MTEGASVTTQTLTVGRDASGVVQLTGHQNTIYIFPLNDGRERVLPPALQSAQTNGPLGANPYRSLDAFDEESSELFFGRDDVTAILLDQLERLASGDAEDTTQLRLLAILGPSGCGKSSVARAGLVPAIANSKLRKLQGAEIAILQPGRRPAEALAAVLARTITRDPAPVAKTSEFETEIRTRAKAGTHDGLVRIARARGILNAPLVILVDQFEEVYTLGPPADEKDARAIEAAKAERDAFVRTLLHAAREPGAGVFIVLTLRIDFYGAVTEHADMSAAISASHMLVPAMTAPNLAMAVQEPARLRGLDLRQAAVDNLVRQATDNPSALPLVQHALFRFWNAFAAGGNPEKQNDAYAILSDLGGAITATAQEVMAKLPPGETRDFAWAALLRGVQLGEGVRDTRRRVRFSEIVPQGSSPEAARIALWPLVRERLLVMGGELDSTGESWVEITHEALIANWKELRDRLSVSRPAERLSRRAQEAAERWSERQGDLWQGIDLQQLTEHARTQALTEIQAAFLAASERAARWHWLISQTALVLLVLLALGAAGSAWWISGQRHILAEQNQELQTASRNQIAQQITLVDRNQRLEEAINSQKEARIKAEEQTRSAQLQEARAVSMLARQATERGDATTGMLAALAMTPDATRPGARPHSADAAMALLDGWLRNREITVLIGATHSVSFSPDGKSVATVSEANASAQIWDLSGAIPTATVLVGHTKAVTSASFSPDGGHLVTTSADKTARVWDLSGAVPVATVLTGHTAQVNSASFSPDGKRVVTASSDNTARLWDLSGSAPTAVILGEHKSWVASASFSPDGKRVLIASGHTAQIWDVSGPAPEMMIELAGHTDNVTSASFSPDGKRVVTGSVDGTERVWDLSDPLAVAIVLGGCTGVTDIASSIMTDDRGRFSPDGKRVVTVCGDNAARVWDLSGATPVATVLAGHTNTVTGASFSPDGTHVVTVSFDNSARVWDLSVAPPVAIVLAGHTNGIRRASFSPDGTRVATASYDKTVRIWQVSEAPPEEIVLRGHTASVLSASFSPDGKYVVTASADRTARVWELAGTTPVATVLGGQTSSVINASFSPDGKHVVTASSVHTVQMWDLFGATPTSFVGLGKSIGSVLSERMGSVAGEQAANQIAAVSNAVARDGSPVTIASFSPDGRRVVTADWGNMARVWDLSGGATVATVLAGHTALVTSASFSPDGKRVVTTSFDKTARVWDLSGAAPVATVLTGHTKAVTSASFSPDGKRVVTVALENTARVWDLSDAAPVATALIGHTSGIFSASFSPDGKRVVTTSADHTARVWDLSGAVPVATVLAGHMDQVTSASFSPDGKRVVTASHDKTARVWDLSDATPVSIVLGGHTNWVNSASFSPDGKRVVTASSDRTAIIYPVPSDKELVVLARRSVTRCLTAAQREALGLPVKPDADPADRDRIRPPPC